MATNIPDGGNGQHPPAPLGSPFGVTEKQRPAGLTLRDYPGVLWRRKWTIVLVVIIATTTAYFFSARQTKQYRASADLIYEKQLDLANPLTGQTYTDPNERALELNSVAGVLASPDMVRRAHALLKKAGLPSTGYEVTSQPVNESGAAGVTTTSTNLVRISATSPGPRLAAAAANAYAAAFVAARTEGVRAQIASAIAATKAQLAEYHGAAKKSTDYLVLQQRLQDLSILKRTTSGNFRVLIPATPPLEPFSPQPLRSAILGFALGLFGGVALAFLLEQFDTHVRLPEDVAAIVRQPILGRIPRISKRTLGQHSVVTLAEPDGHAAEAFRLVRTNLEFMSVDARVRSLLLTSSVQGEGKSITVANLAVAMAMAGKRVVVVDGDLRRPRQHTYFGLGNDHGVSTVVTDQGPLAAALQRVDLTSPSTTGANGIEFAGWAPGDEAASRLYVLTSGPLPPNPGEIVASQRFADLVETLAGEADIVLVDSPALLAVGDTAALASKVDGLVFLVDMHAVKRPMLLQAADQLFKLPCRPLGVILRTEGARGHGYYYSSYSSGYTYNDNGDKRRVRRGKVGQAADATNLPADSIRSKEGEAAT